MTAPLTTDATAVPAKENDRVPNTNHDRGDDPAAAGHDRDPLGVHLGTLGKTFTRPGGGRVDALDDIELDIEPGEFLVLLGPSGCGKSTLLRCIAGLERPDRGTIDIGGARVFDGAARLDVPVERRAISMVFQSYALWPHMTVFKNVAYPLQFGRRNGAKRRDRKAINAAVLEALELVGIAELRHQYPGRISGGQQQRVALARALVMNRGVILFDEPLSNIDAQVRERLREELLTMHDRVGFTAVYVTHDQAEAMQLATRIAVMEKGRVAQLGSPREVYHRPVSRYVAHFIGTANEFEGVLVGSEGGRHTLQCTHGALVVAAARPPADDEVVIVRPEKVRLAASAEQAAENRWRGVVTGMSFLGTHVDYDVDCSGVKLRARSNLDLDLSVGDTVDVHIPAEELHVVTR